jgi:hypothetical protein
MTVPPTLPSHSHGSAALPPTSHPFRGGNVKEAGRARPPIPRPASRWTLTGPCAVCGVAVLGRRDATGRPIHPECARVPAAELLNTAPVHQRCPHCAAPVLEAWIYGLFTRLDPAELDARAARRALLTGREVFFVLPGAVPRLEPLGAPAAFPADHLFLAAHQEATA